MINLSSCLSNIIHSYPSGKIFWVAYSGGMDSHVLLHAMAQLRDSFKFKLRAVHINHNLNPQADKWVNHCQHICAELAITCEVIQVQIDNKPRESLEACARNARYKAISELLEKDDVVLTGQHADDQTETVLLQLLRGAGVAGLASMPETSKLGIGWLVRPLLNYSRKQLFEYAKHLQWIEDDSNNDIKFDRNFLRHEVIPILKQRWGNINKTLGRVANNQAEANELIKILASQDLQFCVGKELNQLFIPNIVNLEPIRQRNLLRFWLEQLNLTIPSAAQLQHIIDDSLTAKPERQPLVSWKGGEVRRYKQHLFAMPNLPPVPTEDITWLFPNPIDLPLGKLTVQKVQAGGLNLPMETTLKIRFRKNGESLQLHNHKHSVKKLLQTAQIPSWQRPFIPLIYLDDILIAIPNIGVADKFTTPANGWKVSLSLIF